MTTRRTAQPFVRQLLNLTLIQLANWRWSWQGTVLTGLIAPVLGTAALGVFAKDSGPDAVAYVLTGNVVMSLLFGTFDKVASHFAYMRIVGRLTYFATLPIYREALILATVIAFLVLALPAVVITLVVGTLLLDVPLHISPWIVLVVPLVGVSLCGLGALIGIVVRTPEEVGTLSSLITFVLVGFGPVILPPDRLPDVVNTLSYLSPATYAASALRQCLLDMPGRTPLAVDVLVLAALLAGSLWGVARRMDWRQT